MAAHRPDLRSPSLTRSWRELRSNGEDAEDLAAGLGPQRLWWRPDADRWSVGECLDHLVRTGEAYLEALDEAVEEGRRRGRIADGPHRPGLVGRCLTRLLEPPPGLEIRAPARIRPSCPGTGGPDAGRDPDPLPAFLALRGRLAERLEAADGLDLRRVRVTSPFVPLLRFDLGSAFRVIAAHERRHLWQARRVREAEGFPGTDGRVSAG